METYTVIKDRKITLQIPGKLLNGRIWGLNGGKLMPLVCGAACTEAGVDPKRFMGKSESQWKPEDDRFLMQLGTNPGGGIVLTEAEFRARTEAERRTEADALEAAVPGLAALKAAFSAYEYESDRADRAFARMMSDENNDGARPPNPFDVTTEANYFALRDANPRGALYLKAERQSESGSWADNTGSASAGKRAMEILRAGGSIEEAEIALAVRRDSFFD